MNNSSSEAGGQGEYYKFTEYALFTPKFKPDYSENNTLKNFFETIDKKCIFQCPNPAQ